MSLVATRHNEAVLLSEIRQGNADAFAQIYAEYYEPLCGFTNGFVRAPEIAEELVQDVFCRIWDQRESLQPFGTLRAYLFGAARNRALSFFRHERTGKRVMQRATDVGLSWVARSEETDERLYQAELTAGFDDAVIRLPEGQRTVLTLRWHYQLSPPEIAEILGISVKGVDAQVGRALKSIRARLLEYR